MFGKSFKHKYALTDKGVQNVKKGTLWTVIVNLIVMGGISVLYLLMNDLIAVLIDDQLGINTIMILILLIIFVLLSFMTHLQQYQATYGLVYGEVKDTRIALAEKLRKLPLGYFNKKDIADLTETLMGDVNRMEHVWSHVLGYLHGSYISTGIIAIFLFIYDWRLAIACLWGVPVAFALLFGSRKFTSTASQRLKHAALKVSDGIQETLENVREIRAVNQEEIYLQALYEKINEHEKVMVKGELISGLFVNAASVIMRLGVATTILTGANLIVHGQVDFMIFFMFLLVVSRIYEPMNNTLVNLAAIISSRLNIERMNEFYDYPLQEGSKKLKTNGYDIEFKNVEFEYNKGDTVLKDVSFTAKQGEVTALVGPSGGGKTTISKLCARFWDATKGKITLGGIDISKVDPETLLNNYSIVFQDVTLFDNTVMENIRIGKKGATDNEVIKAAKQAKCDEFISKLPDGYNTYIGENGCNLSGGERQRISIARAILKDSPVILLDEATASLDAENETEIQEAISKLVKNKTVLIIAHRMRTVTNADKIVLLKDGVVKEQGNPKELLEKDSIFKDMVQKQQESLEWNLN